MGALDYSQVTTKCVEISKSLINTQVGLHNYDLRITKKIGDAARFASSIRRIGTIDSEKSIAAIGATLKIDYNLITNDIIPIFEDYGWITVTRDRRRIKKIDEEIPLMEIVLDNLGNKWYEEEPEEIERGTVYSLSEVSLRPTDKAALISELGLDDTQFRPILDYGIQANHLGAFPSQETGKEIVWSPLYWNCKSDVILNYLKKQDDTMLGTLGNMARELISEPGKPKETISNRKTEIIDTGIHFGFFHEVQVEDRLGKYHQYVFPPSSYFTLEPNSDIFEKARIIVSCIRHGQYHAEVSKIIHPLSILNAIRTSSMKPHSYAVIQYFPLKLHGIVDIIPVQMSYGEAYKVVWVDSPENDTAADMAEQLLKGEEVYPSTSQEVDAKKVVFNGLYSYSSEQRRIRTATNISARDEYRRVMEYVIGVRI